MSELSLDEAQRWTAALTRGPLDPSDPAETRYVELRHAGRGAVRQMLGTIRLSLDPTTQLLSGPSGSGKTTELNRLRGELSDAGYRVAMFDIGQYLSTSSPVSITEFLIALALGTHAALEPEEASKGAGFIGRLRGLLSRLKISLDLPGFKGSVSSSGFEVEALGLSADVELQEELRSSRPLVEEFRAKLGYNTAELYAEVADFVSGLFAAHPAPRGAILIVDGLEKLSGATLDDEVVQRSAQDLFVGQSARLKFASHHTVYTVPTALQFLAAGALPYDLRVPVPVPYVRARGGNDAAAVATTMGELREAVARRVPVERLFGDAERVDRVILASGGHLRDLFDILRRMVNLMYTDALELPVPDAAIEQAISEFGYPFGEMTGRAERLLRTVASGDGTVRPEDEDVQLVARLLVLHMLLGHMNGEPWYEVHPLTRRALGLP